MNNIAAFTDLHLGLKNNSSTHNQDCENFIDWFINNALENNCRTGVFCGDFHHNRNSINISTLSHSVRVLEKLGQAFDNFYFILGNHDLFYRDRRSTHCAEFAKHIPGITVIDEITEIDGICFVPWLVQEEWKKISRIKSKVIFGHFELPNFYMNAMVKMPDTGELKSEHFKDRSYVFSGHFHKRQILNNIHYIGNAFPHNYSDAGDDDRGMMIYNHQQGPRYLNWAECPRYRVVDLSDLLNNTDQIILPNMHLRVNIDIPVSFEEASFLRETFIENYNCREITLIPQTQNSEINSDSDLSAFASVDKMVIDEISHIESESHDSKILLEIYNNLD